MVKFLHCNEVEDGKEISLSTVGSRGSLKSEFIKCKKGTNVQKEWQLSSREHITLCLAHIQRNVKYYQ